jgi:hypothetical protein
VRHLPSLCIAAGRRRLRTGVPCRNCFKYQRINLPSLAGRHRTSFAPKSRYFLSVEVGHVVRLSAPFRVCDILRPSVGPGAPDPAPSAASSLTTFCGCVVGFGVFGFCFVRMRSICFLTGFRRRAVVIFQQRPSWPPSWVHWQCWPRFSYLGFNQRIRACKCWISLRFELIWFSSLSTSA